MFRSSQNFHYDLMIEKTSLAKETKFSRKFARMITHVSLLVIAWTESPRSLDKGLSRPTCPRGNLFAPSCEGISDKWVTPGHNVALAASQENSKGKAVIQSRRRECFARSWMETFTKGPREVSSRTLERKVYCSFFFLLFLISFFYLTAITI